MQVPWTDIEKQKLRKLHAEGLFPVEIFEQGHFPGRSRASIVGRMNRMGLKTRDEYKHRPRTTTHPDRELIIRLRCKPWCWPVSAIAQAIGDNPKVVTNIVAKNTEVA